MSYNSLHFDTESGTLGISTARECYLEWPYGVDISSISRSGPFHMNKNESDGVCKTVSVSSWIGMLPVGKVRYGNLQIDADAILSKKDRNNSSV